jgi:hypothetical protein
MDKLIKKILTDKTMRNAASLSAFVLTVASSAMAPWTD